MADKHKRPANLGAVGRALWDDLTAELIFEPHELLLLGEAALAADMCAQLQQIVYAEGPLDTSAQGRRAHPALVELRAQRLTLARILAVLRLPTGVEGETHTGEKRTQRRAGVRGVYGVGA